MHGTVLEHGTQNHNIRSYKVNQTKTGYIVTRTAHHIKKTPISMKLYLHADLTKSKISHSKTVTSVSQ